MLNFLKNKNDNEVETYLRLRYGGISFNYGADCWEYSGVKIMIPFICDSFSVTSTRVANNRTGNENIYRRILTFDYA